jgi:hypothetical protein
MNKVTFILFGTLFMLFFHRHGYAQGEDADGRGLWGGVTLGGGFFEHDGTGADGVQTSRESKLGFAAGGHLSYDLHQRIALYAEVLFATKGSHQFFSGEKRYSYTENYLELPLLVRVSLPSIKDRLVPFVTAGPMVAVLLSASGEDVRAGEPLNVDGAVKPIDFGVILAAGAAVRLTPYDSLALEARYDMGLRAIEYDREPVYNRGILLVFRYETCICSRSAAR